ncbi:hypothetical protein ACIBSV_30380 [Embleya sp. NPDC050154]|uniref:hypothetical protein n=1 Tax=Embleya sp. NPDC050154 TaxID=3363988 RepID=UPI0037A74A64
MLFVAWPLMAARWLFSPRTEPDREIAALQYVRAMIGLLVSLTVWFREGRFEPDLDAALLKVANGLLFAVPIWVVVTVFLVAASSGDRMGTCKRLAAGSGLPLAVLGVIVWYFLYAGDTIGGLGGGGGTSWFVAIPLFVGGLLLPLWGVLFALGAAFFAYKNMFNANDGHPLLPALLAPGFAIASTGYELSAPTGGDHSPLSIGLSVTGCLAVIGCSIFEYRFVARTHRVNLKSGPPPRQPASEPGRFTWGAHPDDVSPWTQAPPPSYPLPHPVDPGPWTQAPPPPPFYPLSRPVDPGPWTQAPPPPSFPPPRPPHQERT